MTVGAAATPDAAQEPIYAAVADDQDWSLSDLLPPFDLRFFLAAHLIDPLLVAPSTTEPTEPEPAPAEKRAPRKRATARKRPAKKATPPPKEATS